MSNIGKILGGTDVNELLEKAINGEPEERLPALLRVTALTNAGRLTTAENARVAERLAPHVGNHRPEARPWTGAASAATQASLEELAAAGL